MSEIHIGWPEGIYLGLVALLCVADAVLHDKELASTRVNFFRGLVFRSLGLGLLYWGGFFS